MKSIGCDIGLPSAKPIKCINPSTRSWKEFITESHEATFNFAPITRELGTITIAMLGTDDEILTDGESIQVRYKDGTKRTINKSWF